MKIRARDSARGISLVLLTLSLCVAGYVHPSFGQSNENLEQSELLYSTVFITKSVSDREAMTIRNIVMDFNNTNGLPINASLLADEHLQSARFAFQGGREFSVLVGVSYDAIPTTQAEHQTDEICGQFVNLFDLNLSVLEKRQWVDNKTDYVTVYRTLGAFSDNPENLKELAKYASKDGLGKLVTLDFLELYSPGSSNTGPLYLEYVFFKDSGRASWEFFLMMSDGRALDEQDLDIDLNELLANSEQIEPSATKTSKIILEFHKTQYAGSKTYSMSLQNISPEPSETEGNESVRMTYDLTGPVDNVVAVFSLQEIQEFDWASRAALLMIVVVLIIVGVIIAVKKRKRLERSSSPTNEKT